MRDQLLNVVQLLAGKDIHLLWFVGADQKRSKKTNIGLAGLLDKNVKERCCSRKEVIESAKTNNSENPNNTSRTKTKATC